MIVPADCRLIACSDLIQVDRSQFFAENPVMECYCCPSFFFHSSIIPSSSSGSTHLFYQADLCFMASRVITGEAKAIVIRTGDRTFWGHMCSYKRKESFIFRVCWWSIVIIIRFLFHSTGIHIKGELIRWFSAIIGTMGMINWFIDTQSIIAVVLVGSSRFDFKWISELIFRISWLSSQVKCASSSVSIA